MKNMDRPYRLVALVGVCIAATVLLYSTTGIGQQQQPRAPVRDAVEDAQMPCQAQAKRPEQQKKSRSIRGLRRHEGARVVPRARASTRSRKDAGLRLGAGSTERQPASGRRSHTVSLRGMFGQQIHGSKRSLRSVEDFTEFEQRTAYFNGDPIRAMKKGVIKEFIG